MWEEFRFEVYTQKYMDDYMNQQLNQNHDRPLLGMMWLSRQEIVIIMSRRHDS